MSLCTHMLVVVHRNMYLHHTESRVTCFLGAFSMTWFFQPVDKNKSIIICRDIPPSISPNSGKLLEINLQICKQCCQDATRAFSGPPIEIRMFAQIIFSPYAIHTFATQLCVISWLHHYVVATKIYYFLLHQ